MTELHPETPLVTARRIATAVVRLYGEGGHDEQSMIDNGGIWNDHPAVQAALEALKLAAPNKLLTTLECAKHIRMSGAWLEDGRRDAAATDSRPPHIRIGRAIRYSLFEINAWIGRRKQP